MSHTGTPQSPPRRRLRPRWRYAGLLVGVLLVAGVLVFAVSRLNLHRIGHALVNASPGWIALALLLMALSMVLRSVSWQQILRAALPRTPIPWLLVPSTAKLLALFALPHTPAPFPVVEALLPSTPIPLPLKVTPNTPFVVPPAPPHEHRRSKRGSRAGAA